jgi:hypothetical protein
VVVEAVAAVAAGGRHERDPPDVQAPRQEAERVGARGVQLVGVVDRQQHGLLLGRRNEQAERAREHREPRVGLRHRQPERTAQGVRLHRGDRVEARQHR